MHPCRITGRFAARLARLSLRAFGPVGLLALLSACAGHPNIPATQEAADYVAHAQRTYAAPGPAGDPWGPYIQEASARFDVPDSWIRGVMHVESGGHEFRDGAPIVSPVGAMGLMQLMPVTYDLMRGQYNLGPDPFDPESNIMAGAAYIRQMYDIYGTPGFLAAYNAGPGRLDDYLSKNRPLPDETRRYVAMIAPGIAGTYPANRSNADLYALNQIPMHIPAGPRFPPAPKPRVLYAANRHERGIERPERAEPLRYAAREIPRPPERAPERSVERPAALEPTVQMARYHGHGFGLITPAMADTLPERGGEPGAWAIQVGAFGSASDAQSALGTARRSAGHGRSDVSTVREKKGTLYRARLVGLSHDAAISACQHMGRGSCIVLSPNAQS